MPWDAILGQSAAKRLLQAHLASGQTAQAYLLAGPEGVGKRRLALEAAIALLCTGKSPRPCHECTHCRQAGRSVHPDLHLIVHSEGSDFIKIEGIRHLLGRLALRPFSAPHQAAVIDGAERLTEEAANSLLKTLEEPTSATRFFLTTSRLSQCLPTVVSRCQLIRCEPLPLDVIEQILLKEQACDAKAASVIARLSGGSAARALDLAGRWAAHERSLDRLAGPDQEWLRQPLPETRQEVTELLDGMMVWLRDVAVSSAAPAERLVHEAHAEILQRQAHGADADRVARTALELIELRESADQHVSPRMIAALAREKWLSLRDA